MFVCVSDVSVCVFACLCLQLIQDEIKALLQLQQKQSVEQRAGQPAATQEVADADAKLGADSRSLQNGRGSSPSAPPQAASAGESSEEGAVSGYGTLSTWEAELEAESHLLTSPLADSCLANQEHQQRPASTPIGHTHQHAPCRQVAAQQKFEHMLHIFFGSHSTQYTYSCRT